MKYLSSPVFLTVGLSVALAGCYVVPDTQQNSTSVQQPRAAERLGTKWGDDVNSRIYTVNLRRSGSQPIEEAMVYYADKNYSGRAINSISLLSGKIDFSATGDITKLPMYRDNGNYYLKGRAGQAYRLHYHNNTNKPYEIVTSVDGIDVLSGKAASRYERGYVLEPYADLTIEGFRKSANTVASFIFSQPNSAYAANTDAGSVNNTGVIGTAIYNMYDPSKPKARNPQAFPADNPNTGYAPPPS